MEHDIICVTEHIEIHPDQAWFAVVRDGLVNSKFPTLEEAQERADELAAREIPAADRYETPEAAIAAIRAQYGRVQVVAANWSIGTEYIYTAEGGKLSYNAEAHTVGLQGHDPHRAALRAFGPGVDYAVMHKLWDDEEQAHYWTIDGVWETE